MFFLISSLLMGCQTSTPTPNSALTWQIAISKIEVKDGLNSVEAVPQYDGSTINVTHSQTPDAGDAYLIVDATVTKSGAQSDSFDWQYLSVKDASGNTYPRMANDSFLNQYQYSPRITGLELRLGEYSGWMCFEIPIAAPKGSLTLVYTAAGSQQEIVLQK